MDPDPDPGGPKTCGSGSATLLKTLKKCLDRLIRYSIHFSLSSANLSGSGSESCLSLYADPDPAFYFDADPDPTFQFDAEPNPQHRLKSSE